MTSHSSGRSRGRTANGSRPGKPRRHKQLRHRTRTVRNAQHSPHPDREIFAQLSDSQGTVFSNAYYALVLDVSGYSYNAGANIHLWCQNQQPN